jgi:hypothetical protein
MLVLCYWLQVTLQMPSANVDSLDSMLWISKQMLAAAPAAIGVTEYATADSQQQQQLVLRLLLASMDKLQQLSDQQGKQQHRQQKQQQQSAAALQLQVLLSMAELASQLAVPQTAPSGSSSTACVPEGCWWGRWFAAARGGVLQAASLQQLLDLCSHLHQCKQSGVLRAATWEVAPADHAEVAAAAAAAGSSVLEQQQSPEQLLQGWLVSEWLPSLTIRLQQYNSTNLSTTAAAAAAAAAESLTLQQQAAAVKAVRAAGLQPTEALLAAWSSSCIVSMQQALSTAAEAADAAAAATADGSTSLSAAAAAAAAAAEAAFKVLGSSTYELLGAVWGGRWAVSNAWATAAAQSVLGVVTTAAAAVSSSTADAQQQQQQQQQKEMMHTAGLCVLLYAQLTQQRQVPNVAWLQELQEQLLPLVQQGDLRVITNILWTFAAVWRVPMNSHCLAAALSSIQRLLLLPSSSSSSSSYLRVVLLSLALLKVQQLPRPLLQAVLQHTGQVMRAQQQQMPGYVADVAWSLVTLGVTPGPQWQQLWRQQVSSQLPCMEQQQLVDCLSAAAGWQEAAVATARAAAGVASTAGSNGEVEAAAQASNGSGSTRAVAVQEQQQQRALPDTLLSRPQHRPAAIPDTASSSSSSTNQHGASRHLPSAAAAAAAAAAIPKSWLEAVLQQLRPQFSQCSPKQLTTALGCLGRLGLKAPVEWLDALYDALLLKLPGCSFPQLMGLMKGLLHQQHDLAPARIDAVLKQCLVRLQASAASPPAAEAAAAGLKPRAMHTAAGAGGELRHVLWMLKLTVKLRHEPDQHWCAGVADAVLRMLLQQQRLGSRHTAAVLTSLLEYMALLEFDWPAQTAAAFRVILHPMLPYCSGRQLATLLSATARLHWYHPATGAGSPASASAAVDAAVPCAAGRQARRLQRQQRQQQQLQQARLSVQQQQLQQRRQRQGRVLLLQLLGRLRWHLSGLDARSLGRAGAAVSQLGLQTQVNAWGQPFMAAVRVVAESRALLSAADVADLQRSVQYLSWRRRVSSSRCGSGRGGGRTANPVRGLLSRRRQRRYEGVKLAQRLGATPGPGAAAAAAATGRSGGARLACVGQKRARDSQHAAPRQH